ncbi:capsule biosynthesis protein CapK [Pectobacterium brasiliense]|uniref:phenylacetate--CoA ligase family protein n=1 Tax=Pectobacterium brasiliense TaxID=180957 RepID=UPI00057FCD93|nr:phenylacetate--CoA ligase family protein [Pectobacterium brasiliense]KHS67092.1 capsule biosynthesis protein CapK [Pectobacterium brasiliense]KHS87118.1 capsule biosynthesis protein CapK [Pectobacterium brasiliense]
MSNVYDVRQHHGDIEAIVYHSDVEPLGIESIERQKGMRELLENEYAIFRARLTLERKQLDDWKLNRLRNLVDWAFSTSPFYREKYRNCGYERGAIRSFDDFAKLPTINKDDVISNFPVGLPSDKYDPTTCRWMSSSGSSGKQVQIILPQSRANLDILHKYRMFEFMSGRTIDPRRWLYNIHYCVWWHTSVLGDYRVFTLSQDCPGFFALEHIKKLRPQIISSIGSYLERLAALGERLDVYGVELVSTNSETTTQEERNRYESIFHVPVRDEYSSEELDIMAMQCRDKHYHVVEDDVHIEVINCDSHGVGEIVGTDLWNEAMPMIRYEQGDLCEMEVSGGACTCGSHFHKLKKLHGRADQALTTMHGETIPPGSILDAVERFFCQDDANIAEFRVVQLAPDRIEVLYVPRTPKATQDGNIFKAFQSHLSKIFSHDVNVLPVLLDKIPAEKSYKRRTVINKC